ncbi:hypothetical protein BJV82DRAFT_596433, partial [Fennellomyces sp. T-0311]
KVASTRSSSVPIASELHIVHEISLEKHHKPNATTLVGKNRTNASGKWQRQRVDQVVSA